MASIQERKGAKGTTYRVGYYDNEGKFRFTRSLKNKEGAEKIKAVMDKHGYERGLRLVGVKPSKSGLSLAEWFEKHLELKAIQCTPGTIKGYRDEAARTWLPILGELPLDAITEEDVLGWLSTQIKTPTARSLTRQQKEAQAGISKRALTPLVMYSAKSIRNAHGLLSSVLDTAVRKNHLGKNVAQGLPLPKDEVREEKAIFTKEEFDRFYLAMAEHYRNYLVFLLVTGCRAGEATAIRVKDFNFSANTITIRRAWKKGIRPSAPEMGVPKTRRSIRTIMVEPTIMAGFKKAFHGKKADDFAFTAPQGGPIVHARFTERQWKSAIDKAGLDSGLTPHSLRHTFASWQLMAGVAPQVVQMRLGHESLATTSKVYAHLLLDEQQAGVNALALTIPEPFLEIESTS